jgi:hypothetical protein
MPATSDSTAGPCRVGYFLFLLVNLVLFVRPAEIVPSLAQARIYELVILACFASSLLVVLEQFRIQSLIDSPITVFVLGLLPAAAISHLSHGYLGGALGSGQEFLKLVIYYLLLVGLVNTPGRLRHFMGWLLLLVLMLTTLSLLQYHGMVNIPSLTEMRSMTIDETTGVITYLRRLRSTGIFNDPNDLCLVLVLAMVIGLYRMVEPKDPLRRRRGLGAFADNAFFRVIFWMAPIGVFGYALALTRSRGGFLSMLMGILTMLMSRFGLRRTLPVAIVMLPVMLVLFGGRQTEISTGVDTGQERIQIWAQGLTLFKGAPVFGIGMDQYEEEVRQVAHNSFLHAFTELGMLGGTLFIGAFLVAWRSLYKAGSPRVRILDVRMGRLRAYLLAAVTGYAVGILTLSRNYTVPTYLILGLAAAFLRVAPIHPRSVIPRLTGRLLLGLSVVGVLFIAGAYVFINLFATWSGT